MEKYKEIIESFNEYLSKIPDGLSYIINNLRDKNYSLALKAIVDFSEGLVWLDEVTQILKKDNIKVDLNMVEIEELLGEINKGLEKEDYLLVSDIFEYELLEFFEKLNPIQNIN